MTNPKILLLSLLLLAQPALAQDGDIAQRAQRVKQLADMRPRPDDLAYAINIRREYEANFSQINGADDLRAASDANLALYWQAVSSTAFYSDDGEVADAAVRVHAELERRGVADAKATERVFNVLLKAGRFDAARDFAARHTDAELPAVPQFIDSDTGDMPSAWQFSADGSKAKRIGIDLAPLQIIVVAGCHFSEDAAREITGDPMLGPVFARHARWVSLQPGGENLDALAEWNRLYPQAPMLAIHGRSEWALIPHWAMPTFAVVKDGKVIDSTRGWSSDGPEFRAQLVALLERAGLLQAGAR
jgi:hypothetical protein